MPANNYPTFVLEGERQEPDKIWWNLALDLCASFDKKTSSHRPWVILYGEKRVTIWVVGRSLWISDEDISKYRSTSHTKNRSHVPWMPFEEASVLVNFVEKNRHLLSSLAQDCAVQHFAQPVRRDFETSFATASPYQRQDTSNKLGCAFDTMKAQQTVHTFHEEPADVYC